MTKRRGAPGWVVAAGALALASSLATAKVAEAQGVSFRAFTPVEDVCPACAKKPQAKIELSTGQTIEADVIAENDAFYVLYRLGEIRALPKRAIRSLEWPGGQPPAGLSGQDQIVLKNGHVLTGTIIDEREKPGHFKLRSSVGNQTYVVFKDQAQAIYKSGRVYEQ